LTAETDKREAYVGEQVLFIFRLYTSVSIQNAQLSLPDFKDFIAEELIKERKYEVDLEGVRHAVNEWRLALFPTQAGSRETGVSQVKASVPVSRTISPFNDPFFQRYGGGTNLENRTFTAPSIAINVKKLPPAPQGFTGLVGQFSISSRLSTEALSMGDTANLGIEISGKGNIGEAGLPAFPETPFFKVYPGKPVLKVNKTLQGIEGKKTFQYAFVAERPGAASIPALEVYYFNPQTETYEKLSTETKAIAIRGGATGEKLVTAGLEEPAGLITPPKANLDLRGLKPPSTILSNQEAAGWEKMIWCTVLLGPPMLYFLYLGWERRKAAALASADDRKRSRAFKSAKTAVNRLNGGEIKKDLSILSAILKKYISDRFLVKGEALTPLEVEGLLESKNIPAEVIRRMIYLLDQMDSWKYGGMMGSLPDERELKIEVMELLREIEKAL
jgi:hypothetical protein